MAIVYEAIIKRMEGRLVAETYRPLEFETLDAYLASLEERGFEVRARPDLHAEVQGKGNGVVHCIRRTGENRWHMIALTRRKGSLADAPKSAHINIRVSCEEKLEWENMARQQGMCFASWIRWCLNCHTIEGHRRIKAEEQKRQKRGAPFFFSSLP